VDSKDLKQLELNYKKVFNSEEGKQVLEDLKKRCSFYSTFILRHILKVIVTKAHF